MTKVKQVDITKYEGMIKRTQRRQISSPLTNAADLVFGATGVLAVGYVLGSANSTTIVKFPYVDGTLL